MRAAGEVHSMSRSRYVDTYPSPPARQDGQKEREMEGCSGGGEGLGGAAIVGEAVLVEVGAVKIGRRSCEGADQNPKQSRNETCSHWLWSSDIIVAVFPIVETWPCRAEIFRNVGQPQPLI